MKILRPTPQDYDELLTVWEASVRSTHHFLTEENIQFYKPLVRNQYFQAVELYIIRNREGKIAAFMGLSDELIEMLFVHPDEQGKGYGKQLMQYALHEKHIYKVASMSKTKKLTGSICTWASNSSEEMKPTLRGILFPFYTCNGSRR